MRNLPRGNAIIEKAPLRARAGAGCQWRVKVKVKGRVKDTAGEKVG